MESGMIELINELCEYRRFVKDMLLVVLEKKDRKVVDYDRRELSVLHDEIAKLVAQFSHDEKGAK